MNLVRRCVTAVLAVVLIATGARASVFEQAPADALVVIRVNNLEQVSGRLGKLARDLGIAAMVPPAQDPLGAAQDALGIANGLNKTGDAAFVVIDPDQVDDGEPVYLVLPVSDYQAFLGNFADATTEGEVSVIRFGPGGEPSYMANWGEYAVISPNRSLVGAKPAEPFKVSPAAEREATSKDMVMIANIAAVRAKLLPLLEDGRADFIDEVLEELPDDEKAQKFKPTLTVALNQLINVGEAFLRDGTNSTVGLSFAGDGIGITVLSEFAPESYLGTTVGLLENTQDSLLSGLPAGRYLVYGGTAGETAAMNKVIDDITAPILEEVRKVEGDDAASIVSFVDALKQFSSESKGGRFGMLVPEVNIGETPLVQGVYLVEGDGAKLDATYESLVESQMAMLSAFGLQPAEMGTTVTPAAKTIGDVEFTLYRTALPENANDPDVAQARQMFQIFYGSDSADVYTGVAGGKFISTVGLSDDLMTLAVEAAKSGAAPLAENANVKAVAAQLPTERVMAVYVQVDEILATGLSAANQFGLQANVQLPPDLPPVGITAAKDGSALRIDVNVPSTLVQSLVAAGMQLFMQMQGGGQPGGPGGL